MIEGSCHCGAVRVQVAESPTQLTSCNCSICRRLGTLMAYYHPDQVRVVGSTIAYSWGEKSIAFHRCLTCGCTTHWKSLDPKQTERMGVNARLLDPKVLDGLRIRKFDGADTWKFLD
jgi:hypothetical protein